MTKPKIVIVLDRMSVGGIPVACISFLREVSSTCDITLILSDSEGEFTDKIPKAVRLLICPSVGSSAVFKGLIKRKKFIKLISVATRYFFWGKISHRWVKATYAISEAKEHLLDEEFDLAIAYHGMNIRQMNRVLNEIYAKKKVAWIHGDHPFVGVHKKDACEIYSRFDKIFCVSKETKQRMLNDFPSLEDKLDVYYNHFPVDEIIEKSGADFKNPFSDDAINILSVGRISPEKGQDMVPDAMLSLLNRGINAKWYLAGDGADRKRIEDMINERGLGERIILLGNQSNPYPLMRGCDIFAQPSYTEGFPLTIFEAAILGKPIVATEVGGTNERLTDGVDAVFVSPTPEEIACGIERMLNEDGLMDKISDNLKNRDFSNKKEISKLLDLIKKES